MAQALIVRVLGDASSYERALKQASRETSKFGKEVNRSLRGAAAGSGAFKSLGRSLAFASGGFLTGAGFVAGVKKSIQAASDLNEAINKTNVVFGRNAKEIEEWSHSAATSMGVSSAAALETASTFGALFKPMGLVGDEAAKQSKALVQLGSDLASFYNTSVSDALDAIQSGLTGQVRPLRRYAVLLSAARVQQEALTETGKKSAKQLTEQDKVLARIAIIFHDTAVAQGDFKNTSGQLANQERILSANITQLEENIGKALLPTVLQYIKSINQWLSKSKNQKEVVRDVKQAVQALTSVLRILKGIFDRVNEVTGSTKNTLQALFAVFIGFKAMQYASALKTIATNIGLIGNAAAIATPKVKGLVAVTEIPTGGLPRGPASPYPRRGGGGLLSRLAGLSGLALAAGRLGAEMGGLGIEGMRQITGHTAQDFLRGNAQVVPNTNGKVFRIGSHFYTADGKQLTLREVQQIVTKNLANAARRAPASPIVTDVTSGGYGGGIPAGLDPAVVKRTAAQRNAFFDAMINRQLGRVQDISSLGGQLKRLDQIGDLVKQRIARTKDITRRLNLEDQLLAIQRQKKDVRQQLAQAFLDGLQFNVDKAGLTATLTDDIAALRALEAGIQQRMKVEGQTLALREQELQVQQQLAGIFQQQAANRKAAKEAAAAARAQRLQTKLDWAEFALERAQDTKGLKDDIRALKVIVALIKQQIRQTGLTVDLARQLYQYRKQLREALHPHRTGGGGGGIGGYRDFIPARGGSTGFVPAVPPPASTPSTGFQPAGSSYQIHNLNLFGVQDVPGMEQQLQKRAMARPQTRRGPI